MRKHLPKEFADLECVVECLPLGQYNACHPFSGYVINIKACTKPHLDGMDCGVCAVIPFGIWTGGHLCFPELGLALELKSGDIVLFRSNKLTHFNLDFEGKRGSIVLHSDRELLRWAEDRCGYKVIA